MPSGIYKRTEKHRLINKGKKHSEITKKKMSFVRKGKLKTAEWKEKIGQSLLGIKHSIERRKNISRGRKGIRASRATEFKKGQIPPNKGKKLPKITGKNHYNWKGGKSSLRLMIRECLEFRQWRTTIFERDNYTCQDCGVRGGKLHAHHKKKFEYMVREFLQQYNQFSPIEDKEILAKIAITHQPFWNLDNGETLCYECHKETPNYGQKINIC